MITRRPSNKIGSSRLALRKGSFNRSASTGRLEHRPANQRELAIARVRDAEIALRDQPKLYQDKIEAFGCNLGCPARSGNRCGVYKALRFKHVREGLREGGILGSEDFTFRCRRRDRMRQLLDFK